MRDRLGIISLYDVIWENSSKGSALTATHLSEIISAASSQTPFSSIRSRAREKKAGGVNCIDWGGEEVC